MAARKKAPPPREKVPAVSRMEIRKAIAWADFAWEEFTLAMLRCEALGIPTHLRWSVRRMGPAAVKLKPNEHETTH